MGKTAVVLLNLGGPDQEKSIRPFLRNFFMDKNIIAAPLPIRWLLSRWIAFSRGRGAALQSYAQLGGKSPLLENTQAQAQALQNVLGAGHKVFVSMRYWHPRAAEVVRQVKTYAPDKIILLPLYPQFSTTTSFSSFQEWGREAAKAGLVAPTSRICCYPDMQGFVAASVDNIRKVLEKAPQPLRLLFSAHGLPQKIIDAGDPYQYQCEQTAKAIVEKLGIPDLDWEMCYQSRVGRLKWIGPSTEEALEKAARDNRGVVIYPLAFVSEHVETLVEIDMEYRHLAKELGIPFFAKAETAGIHSAFIEGLAQMTAKGKPAFTCHKQFKRCYCKNSAGGETCKTSS